MNRNLRGLNLHVIFSDEIPVDVIEEHFLRLLPAFQDSADTFRRREQKYSLEQATL